MKRIYFCADNVSYENLEAYYELWVYDLGLAVSYSETSKLLTEEHSIIITTSIANLSFDLINEGYEIFLCYKDKVVKIEPHMDLSGCGEPDKDLRAGHNIIKLFMAGLFNKVLGIDK